MCETTANAYNVHPCDHLALSQNAERLQNGGLRFPCTFLWFSSQDVPVKSLRDAFFQRFVAEVSGVLKWLGPAWMIAMPLLTLLLPYLGVNQAGVGVRGIAAP